MKDFNEFVLDWWHEYLENSEERTLKPIMQHLIGEDANISDYIPEEAEDEYEWLYAIDDAERIYKAFFGWEGGGSFDNMPDTQTFLIEMFTQAALWFDGVTARMPSFSGQFIDDMAYHAADHTTPLGFFHDLQNGCVSGMIGMLIYNRDCKDIYIKHIDDMEDFKESLEDEMGESIKNRHHAPHYTFLCWLCYEEYGYMIGRNLFPETF